jgi:hypothetical protein
MCNVKIGLLVHCRLDKEFSKIGIGIWTNHSPMPFLALPAQDLGVGRGLTHCNHQLFQLLNGAREYGQEGHTDNFYDFEALRRDFQFRGKSRG